MDAHLGEAAKDNSSFRKQILRLFHALIVLIFSEYSQLSRKRTPSGIEKRVRY